MDKNNGSGIVGLILLLGIGGAAVYFGTKVWGKFFPKPKVEITTYFSGIQGTGGYLNEIVRLVIQSTNIENPENKYLTIIKYYDVTGRRSVKEEPLGRVNFDDSTTFSGLFEGVVDREADIVIGSNLNLNIILAEAGGTTLASNSVTLTVLGDTPP